MRNRFINHVFCKEKKTPVQQFIEDAFRSFYRSELERLLESNYHYNMFQLYHKEAQLLEQTLRELKEERPFGSVDILVHKQFPSSEVADVLLKIAVNHYEFKGQVPSERLGDINTVVMWCASLSAENPKGWNHAMKNGEIVERLIDFAESLFDAEYQKECNETKPEPKPRKPRAKKPKEMKEAQEMTIEERDKIVKEMKEKYGDTHAQEYLESWDEPPKSPVKKRAKKVAKKIKVISHENERECELADQMDASVE